MDDTLPKDGIHEGVPFDEYHAWKAVGNSSVLRRMRRSALYTKAMEGRPDEESTADQVIGQAVHALVLEPDRYAERFVELTRCAAIRAKDGQRCENPGTKIGADGECFCGVHGKGVSSSDARIALTEDQVNRADAMANAVVQDDEARKILARCTTREVSLLWTDPATGLRCKGRADLWAADPFDAYLWELKKSARAHPTAFPREILTRGYHSQLAWYDTGARVLGFTPSSVGLIVVHDAAKDDVHEVGTYDLIADALELGREVNRRALDEYAACVREGKWPGWGRRPLSVPNWALGIEDEDEQEVTNG